MRVRNTFESLARIILGAVLLVSVSACAEMLGNAGEETPRNVNPPIDPPVARTLEIVGLDISDGRVGDLRDSAYFALSNDPSAVISWSILPDVDALPSGMTLNLRDDGAAVVSGALSAGGNFKFTLRARDERNTTASREFEVLVHEVEIAAPYFYAVTGSDFGSQFATVSGGVAPYTWTLEGAPAWLQMNSESGEIFGQAPAGLLDSQRFDFTIHVEDSSFPHPQSDTLAWSFNVLALGSIDFAIDASDIASTAIVGQDYEAVITGVLIIEDEEIPCTWDMTWASGDELPDGLAIVDRGSEGNFIVGRPTIDAVDTEEDDLDEDGDGDPNTHSYAFTMRATELILGKTQDFDLELAVRKMPLRINGFAEDEDFILPPATETVPYSFQFVASGGSTGNYTWSLPKYVQPGSTSEQTPPNWRGWLSAPASIDPVTGLFTGTPPRGKVSDIYVDDNGNPILDVNGNVIYLSPVFDKDAAGVVKPEEFKIALSDGVDTTFVNCGMVYLPFESSNLRISSVDFPAYVVGYAIAMTAVNGTYTCQAYAGELFGQRFIPTGGNGSYSWELVGELPQGLELETTQGFIYGRILSAAPLRAYPFKIRLHDTAGAMYESPQFAIDLLPVPQGPATIQIFGNGVGSIVDLPYADNIPGLTRTGGAKFRAVAFYKNGNERYLYLSNSEENVIRRINLQTGISDVVAGISLHAMPDYDAWKALPATPPQGNTIVDATSVRLGVEPLALAVDALGKIYVGTLGDIYRIDTSLPTWTIQTVGVGWGLYSGSMTVYGDDLYVANWVPLIGVPQHGNIERFNLASSLVPWSSDDRSNDGDFDYPGAVQFRGGDAFVATGFATAAVLSPRLIRCSGGIHGTQTVLLDATPTDAQPTPGPGDDLRGGINLAFDSKGNLYISERHTTGSRVLRLDHDPASPGNFIEENGRPRITVAASFSSTDTYITIDDEDNVYVATLDGGNVYRIIQE